MKQTAYHQLIESVRKRDYVNASGLVNDIIEQKVALRLEAEKKLLQEPEEDETKDKSDYEGEFDARDKVNQDEKNAEYARRKKKDPNYIPGRTVYKD